MTVSIIYELEKTLNGKTQRSCDLLFYFQLFERNIFFKPNTYLTARNAWEIKFLPFLGPERDLVPKRAWEGKGRDKVGKQRTCGFSESQL